MTDIEVIASILEGGVSARKTVDHLIDTHVGMMHKIKSKLSLTDDIVKDVYADAISSLIWNITTKKFHGDAKISTYLYQIMYNKSIDQLRKKSNKSQVQEVSLQEEELKTKKKDSVWMESKLDFELIKSEINALGEICREIIMDWAFWGYRMKEIAIRHNLASADQAKKQKYRCLQKLRIELKNKGYQS